MKPADYKNTFYRALTLKGSGSLQGLSIGKVTDLEGAPGYKLVTKLQVVERCQMLRILIGHGVDVETIC